MKRFVFALLPFIGILVFMEIAARCIYYQKKSTEPIALVGRFEALRHAVARRIAERYVRKLQLQKSDFAALYADEGKELLSEFKARYEGEFKILLKEVKAIQAKLLVLYLPSVDYVSSKTRDTSREFYSELTKKYNVDFLDVTEEFLKYPVEDITLLPENGHLSRFGNKVVAARLATSLERYHGYRSSFEFHVRPRFFGDLRPNYNAIDTTYATTPYPLKVNSQGIRSEYDVTFPKKKQRVLVLGDSYTFGPCVPLYHTYPYLLERLLPDREVINAGVAGYTITDETSLFIERARYVEPDIVILQVLDNDLYGFFYFKQNEFDRKRRVHAPSKAEQDFIQRILEKKRKAASP